MYNVSLDNIVHEARNGKINKANKDIIFIHFCGGRSSNRYKEMSQWLDSL
jgi:hypothetical protein